MVYKNFRLVCTSRVVLLGLTIYLVSHLMLRVELYAVAILGGLLIIYQLYGLIRYVEKSNRDLSRFITAIKYEDYSQSFSSIGMGKSHETLSSAFSGVMNEIRKTRSEKEEQYFYLQTVVKHIGSGVISFQKNGDVELINNAAKRLFNVSQLKNISALKSFSPTLVDALLKLESGDRTLVTVENHDQPLELAISATEFRMRGQQFTLATIQNIQNELERERMTKELEIAHQVQMKLLPKEKPKISGYDIAGFCMPAKEIGGDYYDFIDLGNNKLGIAIGDVSGKGVPASIYMTLTKGVIQAQADEEVTPKDVLTKVNSLIYQSIERKSFVTLFYAVLDTHQGRLVCSRAGHDPAILYRSKKNTFTQIQPDGIALGLEMGDVFKDVIKEQEVKLDKGDMIFFYTDGVTDAMNHKRKEYGESRLIDILRNNNEKSAEALIREIYDDIQTFAGDFPQYDDITMVLVKSIN